MNTSANKQNGIFITFEGGEGVGKSTHIRLLAARLEAQGMAVLTLREPGGTEISEKIRSILLDPANTAMDATTELLLYEAARAQLVSERIAPALSQGICVLCDRFTDSTLAYQGYARGLDLDQVRRANRLGSKGIQPDRTLVLLEDVDLSLARATEEGADRLEAESRDFHQRVHAGFIALAAAEPERVRLVPLAEDKRATATAVAEAIADLFPGNQLFDFELTDELLENSRREHTR